MTMTLNTPLNAPCTSEEAVKLTILADMVVRRALESVGKRILRADRSRFRRLDELGRDITDAHTAWLADEVEAGRAIRGAWAILPGALSAHDLTHVDPAQLSQVLEEFVLHHVRTSRRYEVSRLEALLRGTRWI